METKYWAVLIIIAIVFAGSIIALSVSVNEPEPIPIQNQTPPIPVPIVCGNGTHLDNGTCVADPVTLPVCDVGELFNTTSGICEKPPVVIPPEEPDPPVVNDTVTEKKIIYVGDIYGEKAKEVGASIVAAKPDLVVLLGDLCYSDNIDCIEEIYGELKSKGILACVIGNHEKPIMKVALEYCGADFFIKHFQNTIIFGFNTEGDLDQQLANVKDRFADKNFTSNTNNVVFTQHKPCKNLPGAHHPANEDGPEIPDFCKDLRAEVHAGMQVYFIAGHEHNIAFGKDTNGDEYYISGGGGRGLYDCGDATGIWEYCKKQHGFLVMTIEPDGDITNTFMNSKGVAFN